MKQRHRLLLKQMRRAANAEGNVSINKLLELVSDAYDEAELNSRRTHRSITLMAEEIEQIQSELEKKLEEETFENTAKRIVMDAILQNMEQGFMIIDKDQRIQICNQRARELLELPQDMLDRRPYHHELVSYQLSNGEFPQVEKTATKWAPSGGLTTAPSVYQRTRPNGNVLEIRSFFLKDGSVVRSFSDITKRVEREQELAHAQDEYRSLFENATIGIYRCSLDGNFLRANSSLYKMHGYDNEADYINAKTSVNKIDGWYIQPNRRQQFREMLLRDGQISEFVSEVRKDEGTETIWVTENAWIVYDSDKKPRFYEGTVVNITDRVKHEAKIAYMNLHDSLTGLPNRIYLTDFIDKHLSKNVENTRIAVHCIDLHRFSTVNASLGHEAGDSLLKIVAQRLQNNVRTCDFVARFGAKEFIVVQTKVESNHEITEMARRLVRRLDGIYHIADQQVALGVTLGVAFSPDDGTTAADLLKNADTALSRAKIEMPGTIRTFNAAMNAEAEARRELEVDLHLALDREEIVPAFQPIIDISTRRIIGFEALARWNHPKIGMVPPMTFIPIAEETGLIDHIGMTILRQACRSTAAGDSNIGISVNVSPLQIRNVGFLAGVVDALSSSGLAPNRLTLEITEGVLLTEGPTTERVLTELSTLGVKLALDDFGAGHASLSYVRKFNFNRIKIDRAYISGDSNAKINLAVVKAVIGIGAELGIDVVAEGVETEAQMESLKSLNCQLAQGYLLGKPAFAKAWRELAYGQCEEAAVA